MSKKRKTKTDRELADEYLNNTTPDTELSSGELDDQPEEVEKNRIREAMERKHTAPPWEVASNTDAQGNLIIVANECFRPHVVAVVLPCDDEDSGDAEANAALIASAPDLSRWKKEALPLLLAWSEVGEVLGGAELGDSCVEVALREATRLKVLNAELLDALEAFVGPWSKGGNWESRITYDTFNRARTIIAKAKGQTP